METHEPLMVLTNENATPMVSQLPKAYLHGVRSSALKFNILTIVDEKLTPMLE